MVEPNIFCSSIQSGTNQDLFVHSSNDADESEDYDFSDVVLKYINDMLMEEIMEDHVYMFQESAALQEAEKSFYEVLGEGYPLSSDLNPNLEILGYEENDFADENSSGIWCPNWFSDPAKQDCVALDNSFVDVASITNAQSSYNGEVMDHLCNTNNFCDSFSDGQLLMQNQKGVEMSGKRSSPDGLRNNKDEKSEYYGSKGKKNFHDDDDPEQGRSNKQSAVYTEQPVRSEDFDMILLCGNSKNESAIREALQKKNSNKSTFTDKKSRSKKQEKMKDMVDLRGLLMLCAQAVNDDDRRTANEYLQQIRQHSSPTGDGMERLAHYFANGLEGRMAGRGTQFYRDLLSFPVSAVDLLKCYQLYVSICPYWKISFFFSNKTIWNAAENAPRLHIVDFAILYGYHWPSLIQRLSSRPGGPPKLRMTGIDFPHPGFRPSQRVEETGARLANYAETFNVPFEFHAIAQKWETIKIEDLDIRDDEVLIVNCLYCFRNLLDETVLINSPRNAVLNLIKQMNPHTLILGILNGPCNSPYFISRFREALHLYSSFFDMAEANLPRETHERMLLEKLLFGKEAMNVIACEGAERGERPETYKYWHDRNLRSGFIQLPLNEEIMETSMKRVKSYNKDFVVDKDKQWLLQGWKGRIVYALSSWRLG